MIIFLYFILFSIVLPCLCFSFAGMIKWIVDTIYSALSKKARIRYKIMFHLIRVNKTKWICFIVVLILFTFILINYPSITTQKVSYHDIIYGMFSSILATFVCVFIDRVIVESREIYKIRAELYCTYDICMALFDAMDINTNHSRKQIITGILKDKRKTIFYLTEEIAECHEQASIVYPKEIPEELKKLLPGFMVYIKTLSLRRSVKRYEANEFVDAICQISYLVKQEKDKLQKYNEDES